MALKDSFTNLNKALRTTLQNVPAVVDTLIRGFDEIGDAAGELTTYNADEHVVGKWTDGSDVYEKIVNIMALPNNTGTTYPHGITNLNKVISIDIMVDNGTQYIPLSFPTAASIGVLVTSSGIFISTASDRSAYTGFAIIRYTKSAANRAPENDTKNGGDEEKNDNER